MSEARAGQGMLAGMPGPWEMWRRGAGSRVMVGRGPVVLFNYDADDLGMRNLVMVALSDAPVVKNKEVAALFEVSSEHLSRIRTRVALGGSGALCPAQGRPSKLDEKARQRAYEMSASGAQGIEIAAALGVSPATISRCLAKAKTPEQAGLGLAETDAGLTEDAPSPGPPQPVLPDEALPDEARCSQAGRSVEQYQDQPTQDQPTQDQPTTPGPGLLRLGEAEIHSRYAGAMLLHSFFDRVGTSDILAGLPSVPGAVYDPSALMMCATFAFSLGTSCLEATKHLVRPDAGALLGLACFPELRTLRPRLAALGDASDALALQRAFAKAMLGADESPPKLYFCDDHFVAYTGAAPVGKGYNIRRHRAEPGRDDTFVTDASWRAICFASSEPTGLSVTLPAILDQLIEVTDGAGVMVGFDRGGAYPKVFAAIDDAGMDWVTYRRAPLATPAAQPRWSWTMVGGARITSKVADEVVELAKYGKARQLSVYEGTKMVFQILTSDRACTAASLVRALRRRWSIENAFKYLEDHQGIHWLCEYGMDVVPDPRQVPNPARGAAKATLAGAEAALCAAERALAAKLTDRSLSAAQFNSASGRLHRAVDGARTALGAAQGALRGIPAKIDATEADPDAKRARPHLARRSLQMVCRLLAYNAELDLARHLDTYLDDPNEYRATARHLLHLGGLISFATNAITVTLDRPHPPRLARALGLLLEEVNATPPRLVGDGRQITYRLEGG
ncbi:MAG: putative transposase [Acidimicrobiales bacterium]